MFDGRILPFGLVFSIILIIYLLRKICRKKENEAQQPVHTTESQDQAQAQTQAQQQEQEEPKGLDQETIDSYPTVVIGEMMHLDDKACPICLAEYHQTDVLKVLPECLHRFHRDCLDEWLRLNATCPVCRTYPTRFTSFAS